MISFSDEHLSQYLSSFVQTKNYDAVSPKVDTWNNNSSSIILKRTYPTENQSVNFSNVKASIDTWNDLYQTSQPTTIQVYIFAKAHNMIPYDLTIRFLISLFTSKLDPESTHFRHKHLHIRIKWK